MRLRVVHVVGMLGVVGGECGNALDLADGVFADGFIQDVKQWGKT